MLTIKTSLRPSNVHGIGLFTEENIRNGSVIWRFDPQIDLYFDGIAFYDLTRSR